MGLDCCFNSIYRFSRIMSICIGVLSLIPWIYITWALGIVIFPFKLQYYNDNDRIISLVPAMSAFLFLLASIIISVLMVFGAIKRIGNCILPWLAIHFAAIVVTIAVTISYIVFSILSENRRTFVLSILMEVFALVALIFSWAVVHVYWKSLITEAQVQPIYPKEGQVLKTRNDTQRENV